MATMALRRLRPTALLNGVTKRSMNTGPNIESIQKEYCAYWRQKGKWALIIVPSMILWKELLLPHERELYEYRPFSHLRVHEKDFPWGGKKSMVHHWKRNAIPGVGFEYENEHLLKIEDF